MLKYLDFYSLRDKQISLIHPPLYTFSTLNDSEGYDDSYITHDLITEVYLEFSTKMRQKESTKYMRTLTGAIPIRGTRTFELRSADIV